ncbi:heterokaryon incompatibility protein-domain-containing protein [Xylaria arbuscula]|nr:heterokaryon incompatibility protein-domain-containing protein [Xylaria arbuscula]
MDSGLESTNETVASGKLPATSQDNIFTALLPFLRDNRAKHVMSLNHYTDFSIGIHRILDNLCEKDCGFLFIKAAVNEFLHGHLGVNDRLGPELKMIDAAIALIITGNRQIGLQLILQFGNLLRPDRKDKYHFVFAQREITNVLIYEILSIFDVDLSVEQIRRLEYNSISSHLELLQELHEKSKTWEPRSIHQTLPESDLQNSTYKTIKEFEYHINLDQNTDHVRVIELLPGSQDDPTKCKLKLSNIHDIRMPLSYVWGTETSSKDILVDQQWFSVTKNLYEILDTLRRPTVSRTIWVDAICINQSNVEERTYQVRLMGDIYSKAKYVIIWLNNRQPTSGVKPDEGDRSIHLPPNFERYTPHEYDLASILRAFRHFRTDCEWNMKQYVLYTMLLRCTFEIISHEWWTRIWTLQEGALPSRSPMFFFRDNQFSFDDISAAIQVLIEISNASQETKMRMYYARQREVEQEGWPNIEQLISPQALVMPLLFSIRPHPKQEYAYSNTFTNLLNQTANFRSTDPRDKIYALESFMPRYLGKLIRVDYTNKFPLLLESQTIDKDKPPSTSWVLDFRFCDTLCFMNRYATTVTKKVTLNGFICERAGSRLKFLEDYRNNNPIYTTPKTLFCTGFSVDSVHKTGTISGLSNDDDDRPIGIEIFRYIHNQRQLILTDEEQPISASSNDSFGFRDWVSMLNFFLLQHEYKAPDQAFGKDGNVQDENFDKFLNTRHEELEGKTYFITAKGLLGIATAPVQNGDSLNLLHDAGVYFILRDVQDQGDAEGEHKHRIIARAVIHDEDINYPEWIKSFPRLSFQII